MSKPFPTVAFTCKGEAIAKEIANVIIATSQWFEFTPLPADKYEFQVKPENEQLLIEFTPLPADKYEFQVKPENEQLLTRTFGKRIQKVVR